MGSHSDQPETRHLLQALGGVAKQFVLVVGHGRTSQPVQVGDGRPQSDGPRDVRGARLELVGQAVERSALESDALDHVAAA